MVPHLLGTCISGVKRRAKYQGCTTVIYDIFSVESNLIFLSSGMPSCCQSSWWLASFYCENQHCQQDYSTIDFWQFIYVANRSLRCVWKNHKGLDCWEKYIYKPHQGIRRRHLQSFNELYCDIIACYHQKSRFCFRCITATTLLNEKFKQRQWSIN